MKAGIIGLPVAGKSTLFHLLTGSASPPPGSRPEVRLGVARVPDRRVEDLARLFNPKKKTWATVDYVDVPGVARGGGSTLVDLPALRGVDALVHVVRAFDSDVAPHPEGSNDPLRDATMLDLELILADLASVERRIERLETNIKKARQKEDLAERELFLRLKEGLETESPLREVGLTADERRRLRGYSLLSEKPLLLVINVGEDRLAEGKALLDSVGLAEMAGRENVAACVVSAPIEAEMAELAPDDARAFRDDLGLAEPGLDRVIRTSYELLGLLSFFTVGEDECRAWTVPRGTRAREAAGVIHTDFERSFIRAEVVPVEDLLAAGSLAACRDKGTLRLEGKEYEVRDGDVIHFRTGL